MKTLVSHVSSRFRTVIPKAVRDQLGLKRGDFLRYVVKGRRVVIERAGADDNAFATFSEWASEGDKAAYESL